MRSRFDSLIDEGEDHQEEISAPWWMVIILWIAPFAVAAVFVFVGVLL